MNIKRNVLALLSIVFLCSCGTSKNSKETSDSEESLITSSEEVTSESSSSNQEKSSKEYSSDDTSKEDASSYEDFSSEEMTSESISGSSDESDSSSKEDVDPDKAQIGSILHAFNWSMNNIKNELDNIKKAGFTAIQLSPMQPQKDYYANSHWSGQWWKLYQPYGFSIAGNNQNVLGNKNDLANLCAKAEEKGIKIIVDVVSNHLAGGSKTSFNGAVNNFEPTIYQNNLLHTYNNWSDDNVLQSIVQGNIGDYPDLKTEDSRVQSRVISLLKEYCDVGIDGFRFDAAKHIETPDDGAYASNYWENVITSINNYYINKGLEEPYIYGEILTTCGKGRKYSSYTKYMSTIDNKQASSLLNAVNTSSIASIKTTYNTGVDPDHLVLWAESHDTYSNDNKETTYISNDIINKTYMIQSSRKDASTLYLARPNNNTNMGDIGSTDYKKASIAGANVFHNYYGNSKEEISANNGVFINIRGEGSNAGAALINISNSTNNVNVKLNLANGTYKDLITNKSVTVNNGNANITFTDGACFLLPIDVDPSQTCPSIEINTGSKVFSSTTTVKIITTGADTSYYQINGGSAVNFKDYIEINVGNGLANGDIDIKVGASNKNGATYKNISLLKTSLANKKLIINNVTDNDYSYLIWSWPDGGSGKWYDGSIDSDMIGFDFDYDNLIVVKFNKGTTAKNANWDNKVAQTVDLSYIDQVIEFSSLGF